MRIEDTLIIMFPCGTKRDLVKGFSYITEISCKEIQ